MKLLLNFDAKENKVADYEIAMLQKMHSKYSEQYQWSLHIQRNYSLNRPKEDEVQALLSNTTFNFLLWNCKTTYFNLGSVD
ncbi:MAG: hypothetical protein EZS28_005505 [Streblomastix strix]|uniref:Uncharacterized protein n=1 Tax=Streblomastix strix TaxID=222440 RepID=A0A5J4WV82_9EUKA|nr:MAG: hypothetical protein EZS28_005505 [Streblomastix strix]